MLFVSLFFMTTRLPQTLTQELNINKPAKTLRKKDKRPLSKALNNDSLKAQIGRFAQDKPELFRILQQQRLVDPLNYSPQNDTDIAHYSKKLKLKKGQLTESFKKDGLDFLLDGIMDEAGSQDEIMDDEEEPSNIPAAKLETPARETAKKPNIYGFDTEPSKNTTTKYVPPHLRKSAGNEMHTRLKREIQGNLNRLSDANIDSIVTGLAGIYRENARQRKLISLSCYRNHD